MTLSSRQIDVIARIEGLRAQVELSEAYTRLKGALRNFELAENFLSKCEDEVQQRLTGTWKGR